MYSTAAQKTTWSVEFSAAYQQAATEFGTPNNDKGLLIDGSLSDPTSTSGLRSSLFFIKYTQVYPWVEVNLGANFTVSGVILHNRRDCCSTAFQDPPNGSFDVSADFFLIHPISLNWKATCSYVLHRSG